MTFPNAFRTSGEYATCPLRTLVQFLSAKFKALRICLYKNSRVFVFVSSIVIGLSAFLSISHCCLSVTIVCSNKFSRITSFSKSFQNLSRINGMLDFNRKVVGHVLQSLASLINCLIEMSAYNAQWSPG